MIGRLWLLVGSVLFSLVGLELGCRVMTRGLSGLVHWPNIVLEKREEWARRNLGDRFAYDPRLGFVQRPGYVSDIISHDLNGFRIAPPLENEDPSKRPILATGDSYTQGDEVANAETWPARLQELLKRRTVNAGVPGYGIDQTVLRTEELVPKLQPSVVVVGFIADDIRRAEMERNWGTETPYFVPTEDGGLVLRNVPVPPTPKPVDTMDFWQRTFGWSILVETVLIRLNLAYDWQVDNARATPPGTGLVVACRLMPRLKALNVPMLVVAQYDVSAWQSAEAGTAQHELSTEVLACAETAGLPVLDLFEPTAAAVRRLGIKGVYLRYHPNAYGYNLIAEGIAAELRRRHIPM